MEETVAMRKPIVVAPEQGRTYEMGRAAAFNISPVVAVDNEASAEATVIEISGRDRPGLLESVSRRLAV